MLTEGPRTDMLAIIPREARGGDQLLTAMLAWIILTCLSAAVATFFIVITSY